MCIVQGAFALLVLATVTAGPTAVVFAKPETQRVNAYGAAV
jgi:hypothetical protein